MIRPPDGLAELGGVVGVGIDVVDLTRWRVVVERTPRLVERVFSTAERADASGRHDPAPHLAARFAAKEATLKAMGRGLFEVPLPEIEVVGGGDAAPGLRLGSRAAVVAAAAGVERWLVSLTHDGDTAAAVVVAVGRPDR